MVTAELIADLLERDATGRDKYNATLDRQDLSAADWLKHMTEELSDAAGYALAAKREIEKLIAIKAAANDYINQYRDGGPFSMEKFTRLVQALRA